MRKYEEAKRICQQMNLVYSRHSDADDMFVTAISADFNTLFELCWKTLKEYLFKNLGMREAKTGSPKEIIKLAYAQNLIHDANA